MKSIKTLFLIIPLVLCSINMTCEAEDEVIVDSDNLLLGSWTNPVYDNETTTFKRINTLPKESYGVQFKVNSDFIERSSGWCGTPPLTFFNYDGKWQLDNTLISISQEYYPNNYAWRIISLTSNELVVKRELTEQEKDHRAIMALFDEIYGLSIKDSCLDANDWAFTAYGAKACGGSQGFIAYSTTIDVVAFSEKVEAYTAAEKAFNIKWDVVSTCDVPRQPKSVSCQNGYPILKY